MRYVNTKEEMVDSLTKRLQTQLVTTSIENGPSKKCEHINDFSQYVLLGECTELSKA